MNVLEYLVLVAAVSVATVVACNVFAYAIMQNIDLVLKAF